MRLLLCPLPTSGFKRGHHNGEVMSSLQAYFRLHQALFLGRHLAHNNMSQVLHLRVEASGGPDRLGRKWWGYLSGHTRNCMGLANLPNQAGDVDDIPMAPP